MKKKKIKPLSVGQRVWVETTSYIPKLERSVYEYVVVEVNNTSAYITLAGRENKKSRPLVRVDQRTHTPRSIFVGYMLKLWLTEESFLEDVRYQERYRELKDLAIDKVRFMGYQELEDFVGSKEETAQ